MLICFTGLHAAGKSYFVNTYLPMFGFKVYDKKQIVKDLYYNETGKKDDGWNKWFGMKFEENPQTIVAQILDSMSLNENIVLDAVHSNYEWELIHQIVPNSYLAVFIAPLFLREERWKNREKSCKEMSKFDESRLKYWHNPKANSQCLLSSASWSFNGAASDDLNLESFRQFVNYCKSVEQQNISAQALSLKMNRYRK